MAEKPFHLRRIPYLRGMFLYNITIVIDNDIQPVIRAKIEQQLHAYPKTAVRLLELVDSPHDGTTYCIHLNAEDETEIHSFRQEQLQYLQQLVSQEYAGKILFFDSTMKYLADFSK